MATIKDRKTRKTMRTVYNDSSILASSASSLAMLMGSRALLLHAGVSVGAARVNPTKRYGRTEEVSRPEDPAFCW